MRHVRARPQFRETRAGAYDWFPYRCASYARPKRSSPRRPFRPCWPCGGRRALLRRLRRGRLARPPNVRLPIPIAAFRAQGRLGQLSARSRLMHRKKWGAALSGGFSVAGLTGPSCLMRRSSLWCAQTRVRNGWNVYCSSRRPDFPDRLITLALARHQSRGCFISPALSERHRPCFAAAEHSGTAGSAPAS